MHEFITTESIQGKGKITSTWYSVCWWYCATVKQHTICINFILNIWILHNDVTWSNINILIYYRDCGLCVAIYAKFLSDEIWKDFNSVLHHTIYTSLIWNFGVNKTSNEYLSDNQDSFRPKHTFIPSAN